MKLKIITFTDGRIGYETDAVSVAPVGGVVKSEEIIEEKISIVNKLLEFPKEYIVKNRKIIKDKSK